MSARNTGSYIFNAKKPRQPSRGLCLRQRIRRIFEGSIEIDETIASPSQHTYEVVQIIRIQLIRVQ